MTTEFYAVSDQVRSGRYPGALVSQHASHWAAVEEMLRLNREQAAAATTAPEALPPGEQGWPR
ncbi:MAG: hypothetical protein ACRYHQ_32550 [Janthinobacterium lividum]